MLATEPQRTQRIFALPVFQSQYLLRIYVYRNLLSYPLSFILHPLSLRSTTYTLIDLPNMLYQKTSPFTLIVCFANFY